MIRISGGPRNVRAIQAGRRDVEAEIHFTQAELDEERYLLKSKGPKDPKNKKFN